MLKVTLQLATSGAESAVCDSIDLLGDYALLALMDYNSTTVPPRPMDVTMKHNHRRAVPMRGSTCVLWQFVKHTTRRRFHRHSARRSAFGSYRSAHTIEERSILMSVSFCMCVSVHEHISHYILAKSSIFVHATDGRGSVFLWRCCDVLPSDFSTVSQSYNWKHIDTAAGSA